MERVLPVAQSSMQWRGFYRLPKVACNGEGSYLSVVGSDLGFELPGQLHAPHPLGHTRHLLSEHLSILHLLTCPLHRRDWVQTLDTKIESQDEDSCGVDVKR